MLYIKSIFKDKLAFTQKGEGFLFMCKAGFNISVWNISTQKNEL